MTDIATFLTARLDEDEAAAHEFYTKRGNDLFTHQNALFQARSAVLGLEFVKAPPFSAIEYEALNRVLADVAAKRAILALHTPITSDVSPVGELLCEAETVGDNHYHSTPWPCPTLRILATIYADHPDFDESWRP